MKKTMRFSQVSTRRQQLIRTFQVLNFGEVRHIRVQSADPLLESARLLGDERLDLPEERRQEANLKDFELCEEWRRLFARLDAIGTGMIEKLEVHQGLPSRVVYEARRPAVGE